MRVETIGSATLYLGDCREILPTLSGVDAVVTDPPYGIASIWQGGAGSGWGKSQNQAAERNSWDHSPPHQDVLKWVIERKQSIVWGGNYFKLPPSRCWLVWNKPERNFTLAEAELAWTNMDALVRVIDCPRSEVDRVHPTQKPIRVMEFSVSKTKGLCCDPYMGSGTTGVACARLGRPFVGIEISESWFEMALRRVEAAQRQGDLLRDIQPRPKMETGDLLAGIPV